MWNGHLRPRKIKLFCHSAKNWWYVIKSQTITRQEYKNTNSQWRHNTTRANKSSIVKINLKTWNMPYAVLEKVIPKSWNSSQYRSNNILHASYCSSSICMCEMITTTFVTIAARSFAFAFLAGRLRLRTAASVKRPQWCFPIHIIDVLVIYEMHSHWKVPRLSFITDGCRK